jgi:ribosomal protein S18 acetylase RimI-like enzyme
MNITISECPKHHLDTILEASKNTDNAHRARQPYAFPENSWELGLKNEFSDAFLDAKGQPVAKSQNLLIAEVDGILAGYILLPWHARDDAPAFNTGSIHDIHVFEQFRSMAVGDAMLEKAKSIADAHGWDDLVAMVWAGNIHSENLFRRAGFADEVKVLRYGPTSQARPIEVMKPEKSSGSLVGAFWIAAFLIAGLFAFFTR